MAGPVRDVSVEESRALACLLEKRAGGPAWEANRVEPSEGQAGSVLLGSEGLRAASVGLLCHHWQRGSPGH